jgi:hypothetical protein
MTECSGERKEREADDFAQNNLIPESFQFHAILNCLYENPEQISDFSKRVGVDEAHVAGRIMKEKNIYNDVRLRKYSKQISIIAP